MSLAPALALAIALPVMLAQAASGAAAAPMPQPSPQPAPSPSPSPVTSEARASDLRVVPIWTNDAQRPLREWNATATPRLTTDQRAQRGKFTHMFLMFAGCKADSAGNCRLVGRFVIRAPSGRRYGEHRDLDLWPTRTAPRAGGLSLSPHHLGIRVEPGEELGVYTVRYTVNDANAGVTASGETGILVTETEVTK